MDYAAVQREALACLEPLPALLLTLKLSGDVPDVVCQMSPILHVLHALDDSNDPNEVPEQPVQLCMFY